MSDLWCTSLGLAGIFLAGFFIVLLGTVIAVIVERLIGRK